MNNDDLNEELFDGGAGISLTENGASFGLSQMCYFRMARCAMNAAGVGIEPCTICKLPGGRGGCRLTLFGPTHSFDVVVRVFRSSTTIAVFASPLDGLTCWIPLYEGQDCDAHWSRALRAMCEVERIGYFDEHWAKEQSEQQGDAGEATI